LGATEQIGSIDKGLKKELAELSGQKLESCYMCGKCTAGCPVAPYQDFGPHMVMRLAQLGNRSLLKSKMIWNCVSCGTCYTRCPNSVDPGRVCSAAARIAKREDTVADKAALALREKFVESIKNHGRLHELTLAVQMKMASHDYFADIDMGVPMLLQGKFPIFAHNIEGLHDFQKLFEKHYVEKKDDHKEGGK
jgi:heterodisulfide reductase subunit C